MREIDNYFLQHDEPTQSCLQAMREIILQFDPAITQAWKYRMPFFCYQGKMFCYLWVNKKTLQPYLGVVEGRRINHPLLLQEKRSRMKILVLNPEKDLPIKTIHLLLKKMLSLSEK